jgi:hypothetical protein
LISDGYVFYEKNHCEIFYRLMANSRIYRNEWRSARTAAPAAPKTVAASLHQPSPVR